MLNENSVKIAWPLALSLAINEKEIKAKPNTPLAELVKANSIDCYNFDNGFFNGIESNELDGYNEYLNFISAHSNYVSSGTLEVPSLHDKVSDGIIESLSGLVTSHINFTKNIVKPLVVDYRDRVEKRIEQIEFKNPINDFNINIKYLPDVTNSTIFMNELEDYRKNTINPKLDFYLNDKSEAEIISLLATGSEEIDNYIVLWSSRLLNGFFSNIWYNFFSKNINNNGLIINYEYIDRCDVFTKADIGLALYLLSNRLINDISEDIKGIDLNTYKNQIAQIRNYGAGLLLSSISLYQSLERTKVLITHKDTLNKYIIVNGNIYTEWLKNGGSPEIILGLLLIDNDDNVTVDRVNRNTELYLNKWQQYSNLYKIKQNGTIVLKLKDILIQEFNGLMLTLTEEEQEYIKTDTEYYNKSKFLLDEIINNLTIDDIKNICSLARKIICRGRFYYSSAEGILESMEEASKVNPNINPREAALLATIDYLSNYILNNSLYISKVS